MSTLADTAPFQAAPAGRPRLTLWIGRGLSGVFALFMALEVAMKLMRLPVVAQTLAGLGWPDLGFQIGVLELVILVLYLVPATSVLGAILMTGLLGGAIATHLRVGSPLFTHILFGAYLGLIAWAGLWLRNPRLRAVMPFAN